MAEKSEKGVNTYTKYEKARIIGARALQLAYGAPPLIEVPKGVIDPLELAEIEFNKDVIPITIIREKQGYAKEEE